MKISTFLTFVNDQCGKAQEALDFYISLFPNSSIKQVVHYREGDHGGTPDLIKYAVFSLNGEEFRLSENNYNHAWNFSPGVSLFIDCPSKEEAERLFRSLSSDGGQVMVPLDDYSGEGDYGFGKYFGWCADKYGVNWQLNLA